ncbi:MAG TPA: glycoside hydrolase family 31 protein [Opitutaceae bacterium]
MKTLWLAALTLAVAGTLRADDAPENLTAIGSITQVRPIAGGADLTCADGSEVRVTALAPDLVRVRAAFRTVLPSRDDSWAIAKTDWSPTDARVSEDDKAIHLKTSALLVNIARSPLLIEFRDAQTGRVINADWQPMAGNSATGHVGVAKRLGLDEHFYGLGDKAAHLDKRRDAFTMWNTDKGFTWGTDPIYQSIPIYVGWENGAAYGIFFDNSYRSRFEFGRTGQECIRFGADGGEINYYFFGGPAIHSIVERYTELTGRMPMPPRWALGNQQCRYSYYPDTLAEAIVDRYRAERLPLDVLYLDIHYMRGFRDFTFDPERFPHPRAFTDRLRAQGVKVVTIVDPGIKYEPGDNDYPVYTEGAAKDYFLKRAGGGLYIGEVWPGKAVFVDYTRNEASRWWGDLHRFYLDAGVAGIWDDMNEPSDFVDKTGASQADVIWDDHGAHSTYARNRNLFALGEERATYEGLRRLRPRERPFIVSRSGYAGLQRYSTMWTGDNHSTWADLALTLPMYESLGLSGEAFVGSDVSGFNGRSDGELMVRWYEVSFLAPLCRNHAAIDAYDHEPWRFGTYYEDIVRNYLRLRSALMPYLYTTLEQAHASGLPFIRPLLLEFQEDANTLDLEDEFMVGDSLLAAPILAPRQTSRRVYLPAGVWYDFWTGKRFSGGQMIVANAPLERVPLYVRGGAILPMAPAMNFVGEKPVDVLTCRIYPDAEGKASFRLYEDDGLTPDYEKGAFRRTSMEYDGHTVRTSAEGPYSPPARTFDFKVLTPEAGWSAWSPRAPAPTAGGR